MSSHRLENKVVLITGAGSGLGQETAAKAAEEGASLALVDINESSLEETKQYVQQRNSHADILTITADVSQEDDVQRYVSQTEEHFGRIDAFFNNAGIEGKQDLTEDYGSDEFAKVVGINLNGVFYGMKYVLAIMKKQGAGSIVNTASVGGIRGVGNQSGYSATKHGVVGLTRNSAVEYGEYGVSIKAIAPGAIMTAMVEGSMRQMAGDDWEKAGEEFIQSNPMKRFGKPYEVANLTVFLLSDEAGFINGAVVPIDGGQSYKY